MRRGNYTKYRLWQRTCNNKHRLPMCIYRLTRFLSSLLRLLNLCSLIFFLLVIFEQNVLWHALEPFITCTMIKILFVAVLRLMKREVLLIKTPIQSLLVLKNTTPYLFFLLFKRVLESALFLRASQLFFE